MIIIEYFVIILLKFVEQSVKPGRITRLQGMFYSVNSCLGGQFNRI